MFNLLAFDPREAKWDVGTSQKPVAVDLHVAPKAPHLHYNYFVQ